MAVTTVLGCESTTFLLVLRALICLMPLPYCSLNGIGGSGPDAFSVPCPEGQVIVGIDVSWAALDWVALQSCLVSHYCGPFVSAFIAFWQLGAESTLLPGPGAVPCHASWAHTDMCSLPPSPAADQCSAAGWPGVRGVPSVCLQPLDLHRPCSHPTTASR